MKIKCFCLLSLIFLFSCGKEDQSTSQTPAKQEETKAIGKKIDFDEFKKLISKYDPFAGTNYTVTGEFNFAKEKNLCTGILTSSIRTTDLNSNVSTTGYCKGNTTQKPLNNRKLEFLNFENIIVSLKEDLFIEELKSTGEREFKISFLNQKNWTRTYTFKVDEKAATIKFPVNLRFSYNDNTQILDWRIKIDRNEVATLPSSPEPNTQALDVMDLAEENIYNIY